MLSFAIVTSCLPKAVTGALEDVDVVLQRIKCLLHQVCCLICSGHLDPDHELDLTDMVSE